MHSKGYLFRNVLPGNPDIVRILRLPSGVHFDDLHQTIQAAFSFSGRSPYIFHFFETASAQPVPVMTLYDRRDRACAGGCADEYALAGIFGRCQGGLTGCYMYGRPQFMLGITTWCLYIQFLGLAPRDLYETTIGRDSIHSAIRTVVCVG